MVEEGSFLKKSPKVTGDRAIADRKKTVQRLEIKMAVLSTSGQMENCYS